MADTSLITLATSCIKDKELSVAKQAMDLLLELSRSPVNRASVFNLPILPILLEASEDSSEIVRTRVYDIMIKISNLSSDHLQE